MARRPFRAVARAFLDRESSEIDDVLRRLESESGGRETFRETMAGTADPAVRLDALRTWDESAARLADVRRERFELRNAATRGIGSDGAADFLGLAQAAAPASLAAEYERAWIAPLDDRLAAATRDRVPEWRALTRDGRRALEPSLAGLVAHRDLAPARPFRTVLRSLGCALGFDPDGDGPVLVEGGADRQTSEAWTALGTRGAIVLGAASDPAGLRSALRAFGRAARSGFRARALGPGRLRPGDPAFAEASSMLFGRLARSARFLEWVGIPARESLIRDLATEEAVAVRMAWAYLSIALSAPAGDAAVAAILERAAGRPPTPDLAAYAIEADPAGADVLRGAVLAILVEEQLLARYGHRWFANRSAGRLLADLWAAEEAGTAETVSETLDLGRIEPNPLFDRCRPAGA